MWFVHVQADLAGQDTPADRATWPIWPHQCLAEHGFRKMSRYPNWQQALATEAPPQKTLIVGALGIPTFELPSCFKQVIGGKSRRKNTIPDIGPKIVPIQAASPSMAPQWAETRFGGGTGGTAYQGVDGSN